MTADADSTSSSGAPAHARGAARAVRLRAGMGAGGRALVAASGRALLRVSSAVVLGPAARKGRHTAGHPSGPVGRGVTGPVARRSAGPEAGRTRTVREVAAETLVATMYLLVPLLMRSLPSGCNATDLSLYQLDLQRRDRRAWSLAAASGSSAVALAPAPTATGVAEAPMPPQRAALWASRSLVRLCRLSAWRNVRFTRASMIPAGTWVNGASATAEVAWTPPRPRTTRPRLEVHEGGAAAAVDDPPVAGAADDEEPSFPIDVVYTWVDDTDPEWRARYAEMLHEHQREGVNEDAASPARFRNRDELRYSLRSLAHYAPFVRNVFVVTAGQVPSWLDTAAPNVRVVPHEEILEADCLPTFNSHAIESRLHRIEGLAEHYLYLNDDFFFGRECRASTFFTRDGQPRIFPDHRAMVPDGPCSPADRPVDSASKNTREILEAEFGFPVKYKMQHAPYPQRRSILEEMEERFPGAFKQTAHNPFRHHTDVNIPSCLSHYYGLVTGAAVTGHVPAAYINISNPWAQFTMRRLLQRADRDVFCLNDCPMSTRRRAIVDGTVRTFLEAYFPEPAPFERGY